LRKRSNAPAAMLLIPKMTGSTVPLPVKGRLPVAVAVGPIVVVGAGAPSGPSVTVAVDTVEPVTGAAVEPVSRTLVGVFGRVVSVVEVVEVVEVEVDVDVDVDVEVVDVDVEVVEVEVVVVGPQPSTLGSVADAEKSCDRSGLRMVNVTVPCDGAGPLACQICTGPELPVVL
jgi:hypothetical protein